MALIHIYTDTTVHIMRFGNKLRNAFDGELIPV